MKLDKQIKFQTFLFIFINLLIHYYSNWKPNKKKLKNNFKNINQTEKPILKTN